MKNNIILSIGVPTWNRSGFLKALLESIIHQAEKFDFTQSVEIIVSDNCSTDDTGVVVKAMSAQTNVAIRYVRNSENIGAIRNMIQTFHQSRGQFWMAFGDDDILAEGMLPEIMHHLTTREDFSVVMFDQWKLIGHESLMTLESAAEHYFYYMGNAGVFAIRTEHARQGLKPGDDALIAQSYWPQTHIAFLAMKSGNLSKPFLSLPLISSYSPNHTENTLYSGWYLWETGIRSLQHVALILKPELGTSFFRAVCRHLFWTRRLFFYLKNIMLYTAFFDSPRQIRLLRENARRHLRTISMCNGLALVMFFVLIELPASVKRVLYSVVFMILKPRKWPHVKRDILAKKAIHERAHAAENEKGVPRSYDRDVQPEAS